MDALASLPADVLVAILVRLPVRSIARCRKVCRAWRSAISHPSFDIAYAQRPAAVVKLTTNELFGFDVEYGGAGVLPKIFATTSVAFELFRGRWHRDNVHINSPSTRALIFGRTRSSVRGSWDGVVCIELFSHTAELSLVPLPPRYRHADQYVLWNPVTMACAAVTPPAGGGEIMGAYSHPSTRRFHLVHASGETVGDHLMASTSFRILRVGDAVWREIPLKEEISMAGHYARCVSLHGSLHWLVLWGSESKLRLLVFDTTREKFRLMEAPAPLRLREGAAEDVLTMARLGVLSGGKLCTFIVEPWTSSMEVWVLEDYEAAALSSWRLKERISLVLWNRSDLSRTFCIATDVEVVEGVRDGEEIFIRHSNRMVGGGGSRIDAYNLGRKEWHMVNVSQSARTVMHRESILQPEVSFGGAARALSQKIDKNGHKCYYL
ncbi:F-box protein At5g49610-like [Lolium perenne]|uniref:F-box protein At5g49610-like n=1 Tax=Lolium perenne TaxID=4522 RepID=UPI0021E9FAB6